MFAAVKRYRVRRDSLEHHAQPRSILLQSIEIHDHGSHCVATVAGEPLLQLASLEEMVAALKLTHDDLELGALLES